MSADSVLFPSAVEPPLEGRPTVPDFFSDLNLDQIVATVIAKKQEYDLAPFFYWPLHDADAVSFRHEVMRDLEDYRLLDRIRAFAVGMKEVREHLSQAEKQYYERQKDWWFLESVDAFGASVSRLVQDLSEAKLGSRGLTAFRDYLAGYAAADAFRALVAEATRLKTSLAAIRYGIFVRGLRVEVRPYGGQPDYSAEVEATFERFDQGDVHELAFTFSTSPEMNHVEAQILDGVAHLNEDIFSALAAYRETNQNFLPAPIIAFDREIQFYVAYLEHIAGLKAAGLGFCYPRIAVARKELHSEQGFDLALAEQLRSRGGVLVRNDFHLKGPERVIVVSGPNQGGKTTFARTFGQLHYLASLGLPVPGTSAQLCLPDRIFTHFEREERMTSLRGKLEDDVARMHAILSAATPRSIVVVNEVFASTALRDALFLSKKIATAIMQLDLYCVWVTFLDEIASLSEKTVSMTSTVVPDDPAQRTFKIVRRPADGLAYAMSLAEKYRLTYATIRERTGS